MAIIPLNIKLVDFQPAFSRFSIEKENFQNAFVSNINIVCYTSISPSYLGALVLSSLDLQLKWPDPLPDTEVEECEEGWVSLDILLSQPKEAGLAHPPLDLTLHLRIVVFLEAENIY